MSGNNYNELKNEYGLTDGEIENAQVAFAAILNGYPFVKHVDLGDDQVIIFSQAISGLKAKCVYIYKDNRELAKAEKIDISSKLGLDAENSLNDEYIEAKLEGKTPEQINMLLNIARKELIENRPENDVEITKYFHDLITKTKMMSSQDYSEGSR